MGAGTELSSEPANKASRQVRRGDSAEEMYSAEPDKWKASVPTGPTIDELAPMAGAVGIELVPQSLVITSADQVTNSAGTLQPASVTALNGQHHDPSGSQSDAETEGAEPEQAQQVSAHESDDEHAVLIAETEETATEGAVEKKQSRQEAIAADRQRVWYKERQVQLTILGYAQALVHGHACKKADKHALPVMQCCPPQGTCRSLACIERKQAWK